MGTHALRTYGNMLGVRLRRQALRTQDIDIAQEPAIGVALAAGEGIVDVGQKLIESDLGFLRVPTLDPRRPSTSFSVRGRELRVDFLTPPPRPRNQQAAIPAGLPRCRHALALSRLPDCRDPSGGRRRRSRDSGQCSGSGSVRLPQALDVAEAPGGGAGKSSGSSRPRAVDARHLFRVVDAPCYVAKSVPRAVEAPPRAARLRSTTQTPSSRRDLQPSARGPCRRGL